MNIMKRTTTSRSTAKARRTLTSVAVALVGLTILSAFGCQPKRKANSNNSTSVNSDRRVTRKTRKTERYHQREVVSAQVLVKFRRCEQWRDRKALNAFAEKVVGPGVTAEPIGNGDVVLFSSPGGQSAEELSQRFGDQKYRKIIEYAEPDYLVPLNCSKPPCCSAPTCKS